MTSISQAADNAADYIEKHGHRKGDIGTPGTSACIRGALAWSNGVDNVLDFCNEDDKTVVAVHEYLRLSDSPFGKWIVVERWNNNRHRTQEEVVTVLRNVAIKHRSDEMSVANNEAER